MRILVGHCQTLGSKSTDYVKSILSSRRTLGKPLIVSIFIALLLIVTLFVSVPDGVAETMGDFNVLPHMDSGAINDLVTTHRQESTSSTATVPESATVIILGICLAALAGADVRHRWKMKAVGKNQEIIN
ncbi:MAG: hypothetical protein GY775_03055 [Candidatus Scalindua sp.]|nr:hypothetical protein [Candidatus Scalindua sp.]